MTSSLEKKAMLVTVSVSIPTNRKKDHKVSLEVTQNHKASKDAATTTKRLYTRDDLKLATYLNNEVRNYLRSKTTPWIDGKERLLPSKYYVEFMKQMDEYKVRMDDIKADFIGRLTQIEKNSATHLGTMFDPKEMPSLQKLQNSFALDVVVKAIPNSNDFRCTLSEHERQMIEQQVKNNNKKHEQRNKRELWNRLYKPVAEMASRLADDNTKRLSAKSLVANILKVTDILPDLNVYDDPHLTAMINEVKADLGSIDPDIVKDSLITKRMARDKSADIASRMADYMQNTDMMAIDTPAAIASNGPDDPDCPDIDSDNLNLTDGHADDNNQEDQEIQEIKEAA